MRSPRAARGHRHDIQSSHRADLAADRPDPCVRRRLLPARRRCCRCRHKNWLAMTVFAVAAITDWADGYLARRWGQTSAFGAFLDPVADKLMVVAALIMLVWLDRAERLARDHHHRPRNRRLGAARMDGADRQVEKRRRRVHRQGEDRRADHRDHRVAALPAGDSGHRHQAARHDRAMGRRDADAVVDVPLPAAGRAAFLARSPDRRATRRCSRGGDRSGADHCR